MKTTSLVLRVALTTLLAVLLPHEAFGGILGFLAPPQENLSGRYEKYFGPGSSGGAAQPSDQSGGQPSVQPPVVQPAVVQPVTAGTGGVADPCGLIQQASNAGLQAAQQTFAKVQGMSLFDYLR